MGTFLAKDVATDEATTALHETSQYSEFAIAQSLCVAKHVHVAALSIDSYAQALIEHFSLPDSSLLV